jgi:hypothetical protein
LSFKGGVVTEEMSREEFERQKAESARRIREMYNGHAMPPYPEFLRPELSKVQKTAEITPSVSTKPQPKHERRSNGLENLFGRLSLAQITKSSDGLLILGLILLLMNDKADEKLILALVFVLL